MVLVRYRTGSRTVMFSQRTEQQALEYLENADPQIAE
jgi:hypothetical protein